MLRGAAAVFLLAAACASSPSAPRLIEVGQKGCTVATNPVTGSAFYEPIKILGKREALDEDGQPVDEYWVNFPNRPREDYLDINGQLRAVNIPTSKILVGGEVRTINGVLCKCPF